jgi:anti-sigma B factor antagonist
MVASVSLFDVTVERDGTTVRIALAGELDIANAERVESVLADVEADGSATLMMLDLRQLVFMDSTGLRILVAADSRAREQDRRLVLVQGPEAVQRILRMTRLDERLEIVADPEAIQAG